MISINEFNEDLKVYMDTDKIQFTDKTVKLDNITLSRKNQITYSTEIPVNDGIAIDLGIKDLAICSNVDKPYKNINKLK